MLERQWVAWTDWVMEIAWSVVATVGLLALVKVELLVRVWVEGLAVEWVEAWEVV